MPDEVNKLLSDRTHSNRTEIHENLLDLIKKNNHTYWKTKRLRNPVHDIIKNSTRELFQPTGGRTRRSEYASSSGQDNSMAAPEVEHPSTLDTNNAHPTDKSVVQAQRNNPVAKKDRRSRFGEENFALAPFWRILGTSWWILMW